MDGLPGEEPQDVANIPADEYLQHEAEFEARVQEGLQRAHDHLRDAQASGDAQLISRAQQLLFNAIQRQTTHLILVRLSRLEAIVRAQ